MRNFFLPEFGRLEPNSAEPAHKTAHNSETFGGKVSPSATPPVRPTVERLGLGEYFHPTLCPTSDWYARTEPLRHIERDAPEVLDSLDEMVKGNYVAALNVLLPHFPPIGHQVALNCAALESPEVLARYPALELVKESLWKWSLKWHLDADWVRDTALRTLYHRRSGAQPRREWVFLSYSGEEPVPEIERALRFDDFGWEMTRYTKKTAEKQIRAKFDNFLEGYFGRLEMRAKERGYLRTPELRPSKENPNPLRHIEWFCRWQIQRWSYRRIAESAKVGRSVRRERAGRVRSENTGYSAIRDALRKGSIQLGIPLRKGKQGRPKDVSRLSGTDT